MIRCRDGATHPLRLPNTPVRNVRIRGRSNGLANWSALVDIIRAAVAGETSYVPKVWAGVPTEARKGQCAKPKE
jgi:hypothetical protein